MWQWPCECCEFSALWTSNSALLSQSPAEQQHDLHRVRACINPYKCVAFATIHTACVMEWYQLPPFSLVLTGREVVVAQACRHVLTTCIVPLTPGTALTPDPGWVCKPPLETTLAVHLGQLCFLCPVCVRLGCRRPTLLLCFVSSLLG